MDENICPKCSVKGKKVKNFTAARIVKKDLKETVGIDDFYLCLDTKCGVGYFNNIVGKTISKSDFKKPLWYKEGADPVYACYCTSITEDDVIKTVIETNLKEMRHIMFYLKERLGDTCKYKNPQGHCCNKSFDSMIFKGLRIKQNREILEELNENLLEEVNKYRNIHSDITTVDLEKLKLEISKKQPGSGCGCSSSNKKETSCCG